MITSQTFLPAAKLAPMPTGDPAPNLAWIANYIWGIADDVLRDLYVRGKYRDVILPMTVLRRLDAVLEATKEDVMAQKRILDDRGIAHQDGPLCQASGHPFYIPNPLRPLEEIRADILVLEKEVEGLTVQKVKGGMTTKIFVLKV